MREKDKKLIERLRHSIRDDEILDRLITRLKELNDDECSRFVEYLMSTFPPDEFTRVIEYFVELPHAKWKKIARGGTGEDALDRRHTLRPVIDNLLRSDSSAEFPETSEDESPCDPEYHQLLRMLRSWDLDSFDLTPTQGLILQFLIFAFDGSYARTADALGMRRQSVREAMLAAYKKIEKKLNDI